MQIIPAIDIINGKCVRLTEGDFAQQKIYHDHPLDMALLFESAGFTRLHIVDLDGAKAGTVVNWKVLENIASKTKLKIDFGGGIKTELDLQHCFNAGATYATIGSLAVKNKMLFESWIKKYGAEQFFLGADVKDNLIAINGWMEKSDIHIDAFIAHYIENGLYNIFCTDVSKDGKLEGPAIDLYKKIIDLFPTVRLVASGGVSCIKDVEALQGVGCSGIIVGKAIYENRITLKELSKYNT